MTFEVEITQQGRGGIYYYTEHGVKLPFEWDFSSIGITIYVPTHGAWNEFCRKNDAPWGIGRRQEILQRLGDEVRRRKAKSAQITIEDHWASASPHGREIALKWIDSKVETIASAGWQTYSSMVAIMEDADLDLAEIKALLQRVTKSIQQQPNRVKYVMNSFVIAVACHVKPLHKLAVETAKGIGKVKVELVGACKIPFAPDHIKKFAARSAIGKKRKSPKC